MFTPAAASFAMSARLCGSSANVRTDAATTGPIPESSAALDRRVEHRRIVRMCARASRRLLADVADAEP
jgi:hypothetical protein